MRQKSVPIVSIDCLSCPVLDSYKVSSGQLMKFLGDCTNCSPRQHLLYTWSATRADGQRLLLDGSVTTTGKSLPTAKS